MSPKWMRPSGTEREFGRRPYISGREKGYTGMMREVTDKAMLDAKGPFNLSEFKKPYKADSYEEMEYQYSDVGGIVTPSTYFPPVTPPDPDVPTVNPYKPWTPGPVNPPTDTPVTPPTPPVNPYKPWTPPVTPQDPETRESATALRWKVAPPDEGEQEHWYLIEVWNRVKETTRIEGGKVAKYMRYYYPAWFDFKKTKPGTTGFKLEISLPNAALDARGSIAGFWHGGNTWYDVKTQAGLIQQIIGYMWSRGYSQPTMTARLTLEAGATGEVEIVAKDGRTEIKKKVKVQTLGGNLILLVVNESRINEYYKLSDLAKGKIIKYDNFIATKTPIPGPVNNIDYSQRSWTVYDYESEPPGRPFQIYETTYHFKWNEVAKFDSVYYTYYYYEYNAESGLWIGSDYEFEGYNGHDLVPTLDGTGSNTKYYNINRIYSSGGPHYKQAIATYIWHSFDETYTEYPCTYIKDYSTGIANGYFWIGSYDYDANNYCVSGGSWEGSALKTSLVKGKDDGIAFEIDVGAIFGESVSAVGYGTVYNN